MKQRISAGEEDNVGAVKNIITHDIAIVFDNSESMYENESWCQVLYAMEVFVSMIDYDQDKIGIKPMGEIQTGKSGATVKDRYDVSSKDDIKNNEHIYSKKHPRQYLSLCIQLQSF